MDQNPEETQNSAELVEEITTSEDSLLIESFSKEEIRKYSLAEDTVKYTQLEQSDLFNILRNAEKTVQTTISEQMTSEEKPHINPKESSVYLPRGLLNEDNIVGMTLVTLADMANYRIMAYSGDGLDITTKEDKESFLVGLLIGASDSEITGLNSSKKDLELARAYIFGLKVRGFYTANGMQAALKGNHQFFGNNPGIDRSGANRVFLPARGIAACFNDIEVGNSIYSVINGLCVAASGSGWSDDTIKKIIKRFTVSFDSLVHKHLAPIYIQKGKQKGQISGYKKIKLPSTSPLFNKAELKLLVSTLSYNFGKLNGKNFHERIVEKPGNFSKIKEDVSRIISRRRVLLTKFSSVTTKRLELIRKIENKPDLKKGQVSTEMLTRFYSSELYTTDRLWRELQYILGSTGLAVECIVRLLKASGLKTDNPIVSFKSRAISSVKDVVKITYEEAPREEVASTNVQLIVDAIAHAQKVVNRLLHVAKKLRRMSSCNSTVALLIMRDDIRNILKNVKESYTFLERLSDDEVQQICWFEDNDDIVSVLQKAYTDLIRQIVAVLLSEEALKRFNKYMDMKDKTVMSKYCKDLYHECCKAFNCEDI
jgi:hypothetical protein